MLTRNRSIIALLVSAFMLVTGTLFVSSESQDPWNGVPQCTNAIADAGGICHGEPID